MNMYVNKPKSIPNKVVTNLVKFTKINVVEEDEKEGYFIEFIVAKNDYETKDKIIKALDFTRNLKYEYVGKDIYEVMSNGCWKVYARSIFRPGLTDKNLQFTPNLYPNRQYYGRVSFIISNKRFSQNVYCLENELIAIQIIKEEK